MLRKPIVLTLFVILAAVAERGAVAEIRLLTAEPERHRDDVLYYLNGAPVRPWVTPPPGALRTVLEHDGRPWEEGQPIAGSGIHTITATHHHADGRIERERRVFEIQTSLMLPSALYVTEYAVARRPDRVEVSGRVKLVPDGFRIRDVNRWTWALRFQDEHGTNLIPPLHYSRTGECDDDGGASGWERNDDEIIFRVELPEEPAWVRVTGGGKVRDPLGEGRVPFYSWAAAPAMLSRLPERLEIVPDAEEEEEENEDPPPDCEAKVYREMDRALSRHDGTPQNDRYCQPPFWRTYYVWSAWQEGGRFTADMNAVDQCITGRGAADSQSDSSVAFVRAEQVPVNCCNQCRVEVLGNPHFEVRGDIQDSITHAASGGYLSIQGPQFRGQSCFCVAQGASAVGSEAPHTWRILSLDIPVEWGEGDDYDRTYDALPGCNTIYEDLCELTVQVIGAWWIDSSADLISGGGTSAEASCHVGEARPGLRVTYRCVDCNTGERLEARHSY